ncbi:MAG: oligosaccharide flippase family protein [Rubrivivax sp.]
MLNFVVIKFLALALNAARSLILAAILGPASYGVLGTLVLLQQALSFASLGMREGVTVSLARATDAQAHGLEVYGSSLAWGAGVGLAVWVVMSVAQVFVDGMGQYFGWIGAIASLSIVNEILININRDRDRLKQIGLMELLYNLVPLGVALWLWREISISAMLVALAVGLLMSVVFFFATLPRIQRRHVQWQVMRRLLGIGIPLAGVSALTLLVNSMYIILANRMKLGDTIGLVVFANTACIIVLFALNTVSWAATSRSMRQLYAERPTDAEHLRAERLRTAFRLGLTVAALACLSLAAVFTVVLKDYAGAEVFAFYFCLLQAHGLLLFDEINQLIVTGRSSWVAAGYGALLALVFGAHVAMPDAPMITLVLVGIVGYFVLALAALACCERLRVPRRPDHQRLAFLFFPVSCALLYASSGIAGAVLCCVAFAVMALRFHAAPRRA